MKDIRKAALEEAALIARRYANRRRKDFQHVKAGAAEAVARAILKAAKQSSNT